MEVAQGEILLDEQRGGKRGEVLQSTWRVLSLLVL